MLESIQAQKPLPEKAFLFECGQDDTKTTPNKNGNNETVKKTGIKREASPTEDMARESNKIQKDSQKSSFKSFKVPIDEIFLLEKSCFISKCDIHIIHSQV